MIANTADHAATQARMLDRLAQFHLDAGDVDTAAGLMFERQLVIHASSATATRYPSTQKKETVN